MIWQIFIGSLVLSLIHASIPNHWIPLIAIGKAEKWTQKETMFATIVTGFSHTISTVMIGIIVGFIGASISGYYEMIVQYIAPCILIAIGIIYVIIDRWRNHHHYEHIHDYNVTTKIKSQSKWLILTSLSIAMFLMPCIEIEAYYFQAGLVGWTGIFMVSLVYVISTVLLMMILVYFGMKGIQRFRSHTLEHHEKLITGIVLAILGILSLIIDL